MSSLGSDAESELPPVDARLVAPESGYEIDDGRLVLVPPCDEPHGFLNSQLAALLEAHVTVEFGVAVDLLTRTSRIDDIAPDASIVPRARDERTGGRKLEHLAFEIASTERLIDAGRKAVKLITRGVRRVFAIDAIRERALEWSTDLGTWMILEPGSSIEDPVFASPLPIDALVRVATTKDAVARALLAQNNPVIEGVLEEQRQATRAETRAETLVRSILAVLSARGLSIDDAIRRRLLAERDPARLERLISRAATCASASALFEA